ncbi:hypothetical protein OR1_03976 [Geobacter sp. OR-1]|uniref:hypothetical protein n=1 Tax=Geobacter sp. OR-1 TaxID=1266765 RepID=UPI0005427E44|nr:hypothetical protein [Geobacter sp. OR-1]GAM11660.1 hypothetical protein OR1_03976 [Geobacter sp. OR-1]
MNDSTALIMLMAISASTIFILYKGSPTFWQKSGNCHVYIRMVLGGLLGGVFFLSTSYLWAWFNDNINPVSGLGMTVLGAFGIVVGALIGALKTNKQTVGLKK